MTKKREFEECTGLNVNCDELHFLSDLIQKISLSLAISYFLINFKLKGALNLLTTVTVVVFFLFCLFVCLFVLFCFVSFHFLNYYYYYFFADSLNFRNVREI